MRKRLFCAAVAAALLSGGCAGPAIPPSMPEIVPVEAWGGSPPPGGAAPQRLTQITLHHQGETWIEGSDVAAYLRRLQQWSRQTRHWADIPYHYVIDPEGRIYAARPIELAGDTNTEYDPRGHALVMVLGNFEEVRPRPAQLRAIVELMAGLAARHGLAPTAIASHKDFSSQTVCPGRHLYPYVESGWIRRAVAARLAGERTLPPLLPPLP